MSEKQYICEHANSHPKCSECEHGKPHPRDASCNIVGCKYVEGENKCMICEHAEECDVCSDVPPEPMPSQVRDTIIDSIKILETIEQDLIDALRGVRISLSMQRTAHGYLENK